MSSAMSELADEITDDSSTPRRWVEFSLLFIGIPVAIAVFLPPSWMFPALFLLTGVGLVLLAITPGFRWKSLIEGIGRIGWTYVVVFSILTAVACYWVMAVLRPEALFFLLGPDAPRMANGWTIMVMIAVFYPLVSALPQELVFRPLFFRRYAEMLPSSRLALLLNASVFSLAHLMYWSWVVAVMTFVGGLVFAWSYEVRRNFPEAVILHSVAGVILFAFGMGVYFYSGNVERPF